MGRFTNFLRVMVFAVAIIGATSAQASVENGATAPDFTLVNQDGDNVSLSDFPDSFIVLEWLNHGCPFVKKHYDSDNMQELQAEYVDKSVVWLSIVSSAPGKQGYCTPEEASDLTEEKSSAATAVLLDPEGTVGQMYGAKTTPHMFVINPEGVVVYQGAIDSISSANPEDVEDADNYVQLALDQAMAGEAIATPVTTPYGCSVKY